MKTSGVISRATDVLYQALGGEEGAVLLHLDSGQYHTLNPVGARMWEILESPMTKEELGQRVIAEFDASAKDVAKDVEKFLQELLERNLVEVSNAS
jgi:PqqD family protein of HPr-rel-A system